MVITGFLYNILEPALAPLIYSFNLLVYFLFQTLRFTFDINEEPPFYFDCHPYPF